MQITAAWPPELGVCISERHWGHAQEHSWLSTCALHGWPRSCRGRSACLWPGCCQSQSRAAARPPALPRQWPSWCQRLALNASPWPRRRMLSGGVPPWGSHTCASMTLRVSKRFPICHDSIGGRTTRMFWSQMCTRVNTGDAWRSGGLQGRSGAPRARLLPCWTTLRAPLLPTRMTWRCVLPADSVLFHAAQSNIFLRPAHVGRAQAA